MILLIPHFCFLYCIYILYFLYIFSSVSSIANLHKISHVVEDVYVHASICAYICHKCVYVYMYIYIYVYAYMCV